MDKYNIMRMFCMFDLPVETEEQRRNYRIFRKELIQEGFVMIQYSIYVRVCPSREFANRIENATGRKCASSLRYREAI
mgnify:CR=1 FL=1